MFPFLARKFEPEFPIINLDAPPDEAIASMSCLSPVERVEADDQGNVDFELVAESQKTRIHVGFEGESISYVNYQTQQFNRSDKQKTQKLSWFIEHYGGMDEFEAPNNTGHMIFCHNPQRSLTVVLGLHLGPIRINSHRASNRDCSYVPGS